MKNFTHSIQQVGYYLLPKTITRSVLISAILLTFVSNALAVPNSGTGAGTDNLRAVTFSQHPGNATVCNGNATSFTVTASGIGALTYQWQVSTDAGGTWNPVSNGSTYANVGTASLSILVATGSMNDYRYRCQVTDNSGNYNSNPATLTVNAIVDAINGSVSICSLGGGSIQAQLVAGLTYQWQVSTDNGSTWGNLTDGSPYSGTTSDLLVISSGVSLNGNLYRYIATHTASGCQATSAHDTLKVFQPSITTPPAATAVCTGSNAIFTVTASSPVPLTYQWNLPTTPLTPLPENATYSGTTTNTLTITGATTALNGTQYLVAVRDAVGCVTTATATLNVYSPLSNNTHPRDTFACANVTMGNVFRVTMASGGGPLTYQWQTDNGTNGVTWSNFNAPVTTSGTTNFLSFNSSSPITLSMNGYRFRASVTGACGTVYSNPATLRVVADGTWRGTTNTNWHTASNWCGGVPTSTTDVLIPAWAPRMPVISDATGTALSRALHIEPAARLTISGGATNMSGPFNIEGTVAYTANVNQPVLPAAHGSLEINGSGNKYLQSNVDISNNLVLGGTAKLVTGNNILTMKVGSNPISGATFNGTVTSWIVTGNGNSGAGNTGLGGLRIEQVEAADGYVLYPIGATPAAYNPMQLNNTGATDHFTVAVNDQVIPGAVLQSGIDRTWLVGEGTPGGSNISMELRWVDAEELSLFNRTLTEVIRSDGSAIVQTSATAAASGSDPYTRGANAFTVLTQFSVASHAALLPISLSAFNAQVVNKTTARLTWKTDGQEKEGIFVVQKLAEGTAFTDIGSVNREAGKTNYGFTDNLLGNGISHYRLKMTAPGQQVQYSKPVQVNNPLTNQHIALRPSVTNKEQANLYLNLSSKDRISITIVDMMGRVQLNKIAQLAKGEHYLPLQIGHMPKGIYYVRITGSYTINQSLHLVKQ